MDIKPYLDDLERRIDPEVEEELFRQWKQFCTGRSDEDVFSPRRRRKPAPPGIEWPKLTTNEALKSPEAMLLHQFSAASRTIESEHGWLMNIRANYGVVIMAMPFGCELFVMPDEADSLPNCHPIGHEKALAWLDRGMPDLEHPYLQQVWEIGRRIEEIRRQYPKIGKYVYPYHPDLQGPMDILELIWGSDIFLWLVDEPELIHRMLGLISDFYIAVMKRWWSLVPPFDSEVSVHWGYMQPGQIMIRDDSAMNLPPEMFEQYIRPYDQKLMDALGGGTIHACGRVDHWAHFLADMPGVRAFQMSQPHLNDMNRIMDVTVDRGLRLLDLRADAVRELQSAGRRFHGRVQSFM